MPIPTRSRPERSDPEPPKHDGHDESLTSSDPGHQNVQVPVMEPQTTDQAMTTHRDATSLVSLVGDMQKQLSALQAQLAERSRTDVLERQLSALQAQLAERPRTDVPARSEELKVIPPDPFNGKPASQLPGFLTQLRLVFATQPSQFQTDKFKVFYAASLLRGTAFSWIQPYLDMDHPPVWLSDFALFTAEITKIFGDPNLRISAARSLDHLRQTSSAAAYAAEFRRYATILNWEDEPLAHRFYQGLKDPIKDEIVRFGRPNQLEPLVQLAIDIDSRLYDRALERSLDIKPSPSAPKRNPPPYATARIQPAPPVRSVYAPRDAPRDPAPTTSGSSGPRPVEAGSARPRFQRLTEEQKEHRRRNNLCMYCGDSDHIVDRCPVRPKIPFRPARASEATFADPEPLGNVPAQWQ